MTTLLHKIVETSPNLADVTRKKYLRDLDEWERFAGSEPSLWTNLKANEFYRYLIDGKDLQPQSANRVMSSVRYAAKWWAREQNRPDLNFAIVRTVKSNPRSERNALSKEQAEQLILSCVIPGRPITPPDLRDLALIVIGLETGMRRMSLAGMRIENFTNRSGYPATRVPTKGHGSDLYPVPLSDTAMLVYDAWVNWLAKQRVRSGLVFRSLTKRLSGKGVVWVIGDSLSERSIHKILGERAATVGNRHMHPHLLRHTFITWREFDEVPEPIIASMTGHIVAGLGEMGGYMDRAVLGGKARLTTPAWLADLVRRILS